MGKFKIAIDFDKNFLKSLIEEKNSGVELQNAKHHLALHPIHLNNFNKSVKDLLNRGIAKYNKNLKGILLGYSDVKVLSNMGVISNDSAYIHYDLQVDFYVFKPKIGKKMRGIVNRKSKDHVGVLVYNAFNVSLPKPEGEEDWLGDSVKMGYEVLFKISFIDFSSVLPYIKGKLISIVSEVENEISNVDTKKLKNKRIIFDTEETVEEEPVSKKRKLDPELEETVKEKKSKKKKDKHKEDELNDNFLELETMNESDNNIVGKVKKKKKKE